MASYHVGNFGSFGGGIPADLDGYTYTTAAEWLAAPVPVECDRYGEPMRSTREERQNVARGLASEARAAIREAERAVAEWRR